MKTTRKIRRGMSVGFNVEQLEQRQLLNAAVLAAIPTQSVNVGQAVPSLTLSSFFKDPLITGTAIQMQTTQGNIPLLLTDAATPQTVANFVHYINAGLYSSTIIHRSVPGFVIQGGGYLTDANHISTFTPVVGEHTLSNTVGTIAMALSTGPNSGTSEWFINLGDNSTSLDGTGNGGPFTAFGNVIYNGMAVVNTITGLQIINASGGVPNSPFTTLPVQNFSGGAVQTANLVTNNTIIVPNGLTYSVTSGNTSFATATITNGVLTVTPLTNTPGVVSITVRATDLGANFVTQTFSVNVNAASSGPIITLNPSGASVNSGSAVSFTASASGTPTPTVQWQVSTDFGSNYTNIPGATNTTLSFTAAANQHNTLYRAVFNNSVATAITIGAPLTVNSSPQVVTQPFNQSTTSGGLVSFTATATGTPTPTVQWQVSIDGGATFTNVAGATNNTLSFNATAGQNNNRYRAVFTNSVSTAVSNAPTLTVAVSTTAPAITINPANISISSGGTATFTAGASGNPTPTVQWQVSTDFGATYNNIAGATNPTLSFTANTSQHNTLYRAVFTNSVTSATTSPAALTVSATTAAPLITVNPSDVHLSNSGTATFTAGASGNPTPAVQWQVSTDFGATYNNIAGATSTTLSFAANTSQHNTLYRAVFTNSVSTATSAAAGLFVTTTTAAPVVTLQPLSQTLSAGATATFTAGASGNPTPTVQWQISSNGGATFTNIAGATSTILGIPVSAGLNGNQYRAVFTNSVSSATSAAATLQVSSTSNVTLTPQPLTLHPVLNAAFVETVGTFTSSNASLPASSYSAFVSYGDGGGFIGNIISTGGGTFSVTGGHAWTTTGTFAVTVTVTGPGGSTTIINSTAVIGNSGGTGGTGGTGASALTPSAITFSAGLNQAYASTVGGFSSSNTSLRATDFTAFIDYGDTGGSSGAVVSTGTGTFNVIGGHGWKANGNFPVNITITGPGGITTVIHSFANIGSTGGTGGGNTGGNAGGTTQGAPTLAAQNINFNTIVNRPYVDNVGGFTSSDTSLPASAFSAYIDYGDTGGFNGNIITIAPGIFRVIGGHAWRTPGNAIVTVRVLGPGGSNIFIRSIANVLN